MTEAMMNAQAREIKKVGKALSHAEQIAILETIDSDILVAELLDRLTKAEITISQMKELMTKK